MMTTAVGTRLDFRPASEAIGAAWKDSDAEGRLRRRAAELATSMEWPDSNRERPWKYYDANSIGLTPETPLAGVDVEITNDPSGYATSFSKASAEQKALIDQLLGTAVLPETNRITAIHYAMLRDGVLVNVPANTEVKDPIRLQRRVTGAGLSTPHTIVVTGANSRVTVVQEYSSSEDEVFALPAAEIIPGPGAEVRYYCVHRWGSKTKAFATQRFLGRERDAAFYNLHLVLGGQIVKGHLESTLQARGTSSELLGVAYGTGSSHGDFFTLQDHVGPDTQSDLLYKSALTESSRAVYYGLTRIGLEAKNGDANQENRNLLLSKSAKADSDPVLEILTNDILRASHGATAGPVDEEQLFYLQARAVPRPAAEAMLVRAFLGQVLSRIPDETLREEFEAALDEHLEKR